MEQVGFRYATAADAGKIVRLLGGEASRELPLIVAYHHQRVVGAGSPRGIAVEHTYIGNGIEEKLRQLVDNITSKGNA